MADYYDGGGAGVGALFALFFLVLPLILLFTFAGYIIGSLFLMKLFDKAGVQGRWRAWVPVYNVLVFAKLGDLSPWVVLGAIVAGGLLSSTGIGAILSLLPLAAMVMAGWRVGSKLGKEWYLLLLWLIPGVGFLIWLGILAFGSARWNPHVQPSPWRTSFLRDTTVWQGIPVQPDASVAGTSGGAGAPGGAYPPPGYPSAPGAATPPPASPTTPPAPPTTPPAPPTTPPAPPTTPPAPPTTPPPPASPPAGEPPRV